MKKIISLFVLALLSSQMWASNGWGCGFFSCKIDSKDGTSGGGTVSAISGTTTSYSGYTTFTDKASYSNFGGGGLDGYYVKVTAKPNDGYKFKAWEVNLYRDGNDTKKSIINVVKSDNVITYQIATNSSCDYDIWAIFELDNGGGDEPAGPTAGSLQSYTVTPGEHVRQQVANVSIPNFDKAVDLGFDCLWADKNVGAASTSYRGTAYTWAQATALSSSTLGGDGWRLPTNNETDNMTLSRCDVSKVGNEWTLTRSGYNDVELIFTGEGAGAHRCWLSQASLAYFGFRNTTCYYNSSDPNAEIINSSTLFVRPVFDLAAAGIKKLTIQMVKDDVTSTNIYYCANNQQVTITPATINGYTSSWTSGQSGTGAKTFTVTANTSATITYEESITYVTATFNNYDGTQLEQYTNVVSGTTPTYDGTTPTKPSTNEHTYTFNGWDPALDDITSNTTYTAQFSENTRTYTIRFFMEAGDETPIQTLQVAYNETPVCTASVTKTADTYWTYEFDGWDGNDDGVADGVSAVTGDKDYVAVFTKTSTGVIPNYNVIIGSYSNGSVTLTANGQTEVVPTTGGTYPYEDGTTIIVKALPAKGYHFNQWNDAVTTANRQIEEISANVTLTPTFATNVPFDMYDTWTQADCSSNYNFDDYLTVTLVGRTFTAGQWATLSVPFDYTLTADDALYNAIYKFTNVTLSSGGSSVFLEFVRTNDIEKNEPYLVVPRQAGINEVVFDGVKLETPVQKTPTTDNRVAFVSTLWQQEISGPNDFYIGKLSTLYYAPNSGMTIKGNRAFFRKIGDAASAPRRAIIVIDGEEVEVEIAGDAIEEVQDVRKYMENGILIIERNGVRMDAQGKRIN